MCTAPSTPAAGPESSMVTGRSPAVAWRTTPPFDCMMRKGAAALARTDALGRGAQVGLAIGLHQHIDQRGHGAFVLAVLGQHHRRERDEEVRVVAGDEFARAALVVVVGVGVQEADGDAAHPARGELAGGLDQRLLVQRLQLLAPVGHAALHLAHQVERHEARRLHPEEGVAVAVGHRLARDLDDVAEALRHDQAEPVELVLQDGVGRRGRAVQQAGDGALVLPPPPRPPCGRRRAGRCWGRPACSASSAHSGCRPPRRWRRHR